MENLTLEKTINLIGKKQKRNFIYSVILNFLTLWLFLCLWVTTEQLMSLVFHTDSGKELKYSLRDYGRSIAKEYYDEEIYLPLVRAWKKGDYDSRNSETYPKKNWKPDRMTKDLVEEVKNLDAYLRKELDVD